MLRLRIAHIRNASGLIRFQVYAVVITVGGVITVVKIHHGDICAAVDMLFQHIVKIGIKYYIRTAKKNIRLGSFL